MTKRDREAEAEPHRPSFWQASLALLTVSLTCLFTYPVLAQIVPDNSLGNENSVVTPNATVKDAITDLIEGGAIRGNNLFHSFEQFNINEGGRVYFANPDGVANILTRITGNNISEIFGTLGVNGGANLFLLNPNGIVFGENAALDVNGSFLATTANSFVFENGFKYSATNPQTPPLLTINIPKGLQMGNNSGKLEIKDSGHNIIRASDLDPFINFDDSNGLRMKPNQTFSLIANSINLDGGILVAPQGEIQLGSVAQGKVILNAKNSNSWSLDYTEIKRFADINLSNKALIDISSLNSGAINLRGKNIILQTASVISSNNLGDKSARAISIEAEELVKLTGLDKKTLTRTSISSEYFGLAKGLSIDLKSKNLIVTNGGFIEASNRHLGRGGDVRVKMSDSIVVNGLNPINSVISSGIVTANFAGGKAGNLNLDANRIKVIAGGNVTSNVFADGAGGNVTINAPESIFVNGFDPNTHNPSVISSYSFNQGNAGDLTINTARLQIRDGGRIDSTTFAAGNAGSLKLNAAESVEIMDSSSNLSLPTSISSGALVNNIPILKEVFNLPNIPSGNAGSIAIATPNLVIANGGEVSVSNKGFGSGGSIQINSDRLVLDNQGIIDAFSASGGGGNINLNLQDFLFLRNGSTVSTEARGTFANSKSGINGGNISINADLIALLENSTVNANALQGNGGNIDISTQGLFVSPNSKITASSQFGLDGTVEIEKINGDRDLESNRLPENTVDPSSLITSSCATSNENTFSVTGNGGVPNSPYSTQSLNATWYDLRLVKQEQTNLVSLAKPLTEANTAIVNDQGKLELIALTPLSTYRWVKSNCPNFK